MKVEGNTQAAYFATLKQTYETHEAFTRLRAEAVFSSWESAKTTLQDFAKASTGWVAPCTWKKKIDALDAELKPYKKALFKVVDVYNSFLKIEAAGAAGKRPSNGRTRSRRPSGRTTS